VVPALLLLPIAAFVSALFSGVPMLGIFGQMVEGDTAFFTLALAILALLFPFFLRTKSSVFSFYMAVFAAFFVSTLFLVIRLAFGASVLSFGYFTNVVGNLIGGWNDVGVFAGLIVVLSLLALEILPARGNFKWFLYTALVAGLGLLVVVNFSFLWYVIAAFTGFSVLYQASFGRKRAGVPFSFSGLRSVVSVPALASLILALVFIFFGSSISPKISAALSISQIQAWPAWSSTISVAQNSLASHPFFGLDPAELPKIAQYIGLDVQKFNVCLGSTKYDKHIEDEVQNAVATGGNGTPWSIVVGKNNKKYPLSGAQPISAIKQLIDLAGK
jgi:hypothetical protein